MTNDLDHTQAFAAELVELRPATLSDADTAQLQSLIRA
ncbi:hypothetical protein ABIA94_007693 [Bradyrhizobium sp. LA7.1]